MKEYNKILKKLKEKEVLTYEEVEYVIDSYITGFLDDKQMSKFIMHIYNNGLTKEECFYLTKAMVSTGEIIDLKKLKYPNVDKHSTGGVGDKISIIVAPLVASLLLCVPKMSGRSLGLTGGTVDKLESIPGYKVDLNKKEFFNILNKVGCAVISQSETIALADKKIYALRDEIGAVDSIPLIASSIMSKKIASGSDNIVIDLKVGSGAFMKTIEDATKLSRTMIDIGKSYNRKVVCILSDMDNPLGRNIGNKLEIMEVIDFFDGVYDKRLYELVIKISSVMVSVGKNISIRKATKEVKLALDSGLAKLKFYEWIKAQGGKIKDLKINAKKYIISSSKTGYINKIDAHALAQVVYDLGAGRHKKTDKIDYDVGIIINKALGSKVTKGEALAVIYYNKEIDDMYNKVRKAFTIEEKKKRIKSIVYKTIK